MTEQAEARWGCPKCGSDHIIEWNTVYIGYTVDTWDDDGLPEGYDGCGDPVWDSAAALGVDPLHCKDCGYEFDRAKRLDQEEATL